MHDIDAICSYQDGTHHILGNAGMLNPRVYQQLTLNIISSLQFVHDRYTIIRHSFAEEAEGTADIRRMYKPG